MNIKNIIKKQTVVIAFAIFMVAVTAIGVSYSVFFDVKSNRENQVITAGTLEVTITMTNSSALTPEPLSIGEGLKSVPISYTVNNSKAENLPATYKVYLSVEDTTTIDTSKIMISNDGDNTKGETAQVLSSLQSVDTLDGTSGNYYLVGDGSVAAGENSSTKYLRVWISEDDDAIEGNVQLKLYAVSEVDETKAME